MKKLKQFVSNLGLKRIILFFADAILIISALVFFLLLQDTKAGMYSQQAATRWDSKNKDFAQISAFLSQTSGLKESEISGIRSGILTKMEEAQTDNFSGTEAWVDGYSGNSSVTIRRESHAAEVIATGVGGDFFQFHQWQLLSGSYIGEEDVNNDRVVIDENLAWNLFGSNDVVGMQVYIAEKPFFVAGVVRPEKDDLTKIAYGRSSHIYMDYSRLQNIDENLRITCYEAILLNPIDGFALSVVKGAFQSGGQVDGADTEDGLDLEDASMDDKESKLFNLVDFSGIEIVENSSRYRTFSLLKSLKHYELLGMKTNGVTYPYWENAAKAYEAKMLVYFFFFLLSMLLPVITLVYYGIKTYRNRKWHSEDFYRFVREKIDDRVEASRERRYEESEWEKRYVEENTVSETESEDEGDETEDIEISEIAGCIQVNPEDMDSEE